MEKREKIKQYTRKKEMGTKIKESVPGKGNGNKGEVTWKQSFWIM